MMTHWGAISVFHPCSPKALPSQVGSEFSHDTHTHTITLLTHYLVLGTFLPLEMLNWH